MYRERDKISEEISDLSKSKSWVCINKNERYLLGGKHDAAAQALKTEKKTPNHSIACQMAKIEFVTIYNPLFPSDGPHRLCLLTQLDVEL